MTLFGNLDLPILQRQFKQRDDLILHELGGNGTATQSGKFFFDEANVLCGLNDADLVLAAFGLDGDDVLTPMSIEPDIQLIDLNLADALNSRAQVVLQTICCQTKECIDEPIVPNDCQKRLLVVQCVGSDNFGCSIRNIDPYKIISRDDTIDLNKGEPVSRASGKLDYPFHTFRLCGDDALWQSSSESERVNHIP